MLGGFIPKNDLNRFQTTSRSNESTAKSLQVFTSTSINWVSTRAVYTWQSKSFCVIISSSRWSFIYSFKLLLLKGIRPTIAFFYSFQALKKRIAPTSNFAEHPPALGTCYKSARISEMFSIKISIFMFTKKTTYSIDGIGAFDGLDSYHHLKVQASRRRKEGWTVSVKNRIFRRITIWWFGLAFEVTMNSFLSLYLLALVSISQPIWKRRAVPACDHNLQYAIVKVILRMIIWRNNYILVS
jgi:hypothetical protein